MSADNSNNDAETSQLACANDEYVKEQIHNIKEVKIVNNNNSNIEENFTENEISNINNDEDHNEEISTCETDHASTTMKAEKDKKRKTCDDKTNIHKKTRVTKSKTTSSSFIASTRVHNRPIYNIAGVNISALIQSISKLTDANTNGAGDGSLLYNRKTRRVRRRSSILEDHPAFIAHRQLRENWENEMTNSKLLMSSHKHIGENTQEHKTQKQSQQTKALNSCQSRQHYTELRHLRNAFTAAPFASAVDVLNSLTEWCDSPSLVYAELLWNYAPEAAKEMMTLDMNSVKVKNETNVLASSITTCINSTKPDRKISAEGNLLAIIKNEKGNEDGD